MDNTYQKNKVGEIFSVAMSDKYAELAQSSSVFAELENMFRLYSLFKEMKFMDAFRISGTDLSYLNRYSLKKSEHELPETLPGLINYSVIEKNYPKENGILTIQNLYIVAGGADLNVSINKNNLMYDEYINEKANLILYSRPEKKSVYWYLKS